MPTPDERFEARVSLLEQEVAQLRERVELSGADAAAARMLASGADRDVSEVRAELRAHTRALNALRETQLDQGDRLTALESEMRDGFAAVHTELTEMRQGFTTVHTGMARMTVLLENIAGSEQG